MERPDIEKRDCKPDNYNFLSTTLHRSRTFCGREEILISLEQLLLKSLLTPSPAEKPESINSVRLFEGKQRMVTTFLFSELKKHRSLASQLLRIYRVKYN